jgi:hypothetical protein
MTCMHTMVRTYCFEPATMPGVFAPCEDMVFRPLRVLQWCTECGAIAEGYGSEGATWTTPAPASPEQVCMWLKGLATRLGLDKA